MVGRSPLTERVKNALIDLMKTAGAGDKWTYAALTAAAGANVRIGSGYTGMVAARKALLRDFNLVVVNWRGKGLRVLWEPDEKMAFVEHDLDLKRKITKRHQQILKTIDRDDLDDHQLARINALSGIIKVVDAMIGEKTRREVVERFEAAGLTEVDAVQTLDAYRAVLRPKATKTRPSGAVRASSVADVPGHFSI